jgi:hypothetical protein
LWCGAGASSLSGNTGQGPHRFRSRLLGGLTGLLLLAATIVAALLTVTGGASAQPLPLTRSMTESHTSLAPGALITYTVTLTNPDAADKVGVSIFVFPDAEILSAPQAGSDPVWVLNAPALQALVPVVPAGGTVVLPLVLLVNAIPADNVLSAFLEVLGNPNLQVDIPVGDADISVPFPNRPPIFTGSVLEVQFQIATAGLVLVPTTVTALYRRGRRSTPHSLTAGLVLPFGVALTVRSRAASARFL